MIARAPGGAQGRQVGIRADGRTARHPVKWASLRRARSRSLAPMPVALAVACAAAAWTAGCGGGHVTRLRSTAAPTSGPSAWSLALATGRVRLDLELRHGDAELAGAVDLVFEDRGRDLLATLRVASIVPRAGDPAELAGLGGMVFRWRTTRRGEITAAAGPSGALPAPVLAAAATRVWPLLAAALPRLPAGPVAEGASWSGETRTEIVGGGAERIVQVKGRWTLAKVLTAAPRTAVIEGEVTVTVRAPDRADPIDTWSGRTAAYMDVESGRLELLSVAGATRRLRALRR